MNKASILYENCIIWFVLSREIDWYTNVQVFQQTYMSNWISSGIGMGTGGITTTDNIPQTTEIFGCPTDNIPQTTDKYARLYADFKLFISIFDFT